MKSKSISACLFVAAFILLMIVSSCHHNNVTNNPCGSSPVFASWKVDGTAYQATSLSGAYNASSISLTMYACVPSSVAPSINMEIPHPLSVGTFPLSWKMQHSQAANGTGGADYVIYNGDSYFTDNTVHTGTFTVTSMNPVDSTFSATFQFTAADDAGTGIVHISNGVITDFGY